MTIIRWRQWKVWGYVLEGELAELGSLGVAMSSQVVYYRWAHWWQKGLLYFGRNTETVKTPEPCSLCSFVALSSWAIDLSCRYLETAQKQELETGKTFSLENPHELSVNAEPLGLEGVCIVCSPRKWPGSSGLCAAPSMLILILKSFWN